MEDFNDYKKIDKVLIETGRLVKLDYLWPINEEEEKEKFLKGKIENPKFLYRNLEYSPEEVRKKLNNLKPPDSVIGKIYKEKIKEKLLSNKITASRGKADIVKKLSIRLFQAPTKTLTVQAETLLKRLPNIRYEKSVAASKLKRAIEKELRVYRLDDWKVIATDRKLAAVYPSEKTIKINKKGKFSEKALKRLVIHEIGVHVLRAANGYHQPFKMFALGLPGYLSTEEGLAAYFEELTGNTDEEKMRDYAGRVIAVNSVCKNLSFREAYEKLRGYGFTEGKAWRLAIRAHRGGGYIKDHVYLKGYFQVKKFAEKNGDLKSLYVGKIGIQHLPLVKNLLKEGILKKPKYLPVFLR